MQKLKDLWNNKINKKVDKQGKPIPIHGRMWFIPVVLICVIIFQEFIL